MSGVGAIQEIPHFGRVIHAARGRVGPMLFGPYVPMPPGDWKAAYELAAVGTSQHPGDARVALLEVTCGEPAMTLAVLPVTAEDLSTDRTWSRHTVEFALDEPIMGIEFRIVSDGRVDLFARASVDLQPVGAPALTTWQSPGGRAKKWLSRVRAR
jgi:hypothetical protein